MKEPSEFEGELRSLLNRHCKENDSHTPDYILAKYLNGCLQNYNKTVTARDKWFGIDPWEKVFGHPFENKVKDKKKK